MECRRLLVERVERFKEERVLEKLCEAEGRSREENKVGNEDSAAIAYIFEKLSLEAMFQYHTVHP